MNDNGKFEDHGQGQNDYMTDVLSQKADDFIRASTSDSHPFFLYLATYAPHEPATPAPRAANLFSNLIAPRTPSFNEADVSDKPPALAADPLLNGGQIANLDQLYRDRVRSMQTVDEMLARLINTLQETGQLDNTYIIFTSDNGYHLGQHRLMSGKGTPYEEDIVVPLIVRGPNVQADAALDGYVSGNIDIAPTVADLAGVVPPSYVDGPPSSRCLPLNVRLNRIGVKVISSNIMARAKEKARIIPWLLTTVLINCLSHRTLTGSCRLRPRLIILRFAHRNIHMWNIKVVSTNFTISSRIHMN